MRCQVDQAVSTAAPYRLFQRIQSKSVEAYDAIEQLHDDGKTKETREAQEVDNRKTKSQTHVP